MHSMTATFVHCVQKCKCDAHGHVNHGNYMFVGVDEKVVERRFSESKKSARDTKMGLILVL